MIIETIPPGNAVAEIELIYKPLLKISSLPKVLRSSDAYRFFLETWDKSKLQFVEQFRVMLLNRASRVLGICTLTTGTAAYTIADPKLIFVTALKANVGRIIIAHNHPGGNLNPSKQDCLLTNRIKEGGKLLEVSLEDHLIVTTDGYYSFADEGTL